MRRSAFRVRRSGSPGPAPTMWTTPSGAPAAPGRLTSPSMRSRAAASRPASTSSATAPSKTRAQKRCRCTGSGMTARTEARKLSAKRARRPRRAGRSASIRARRRRASTGEVPPLEMPITTGSRSTMAGTTKLDSPGRSTTLTGTPAARAASATRASTSLRPVPRRPRLGPRHRPPRTRAGPGGAPPGRPGPRPPGPRAARPR